MPGIREPLFVLLVEAQECSSDSPPLPCAKRILGEVDEWKDLSNYEANMVLGLRAFYYFQNHDNREAILAYQDLLSQPELRPGSHEWARWHLPELYFREKRYQDALEAVEKAISLEADPGTALLRFRVKVVDAMSGKRQIKNREELDRVVAEMFASIVAAYDCRLSHRRAPSFNDFSGESVVMYLARGNACEEPLLELEQRGSPLRIRFAPPPKLKPRAPPPPADVKPKSYDLLRGSRRAAHLSTMSC